MNYHLSLNLKVSLTAQKIEKQKSLCFSVKGIYCHSLSCNVSSLHPSIPDAPWTVLLANIEPESTGVTVGGLIPARSYQFRLCAVNDVGRGQFSKETDRWVLLASSEFHTILPVQGVTWFEPSLHRRCGGFRPFTVLEQPVLSPSSLQFNRKSPGYFL